MLLHIITSEEAFTFRHVNSDLLFSFEVCGSEHVAMDLSVSGK